LVELLTGCPYGLPVFCYLCLSPPENNPERKQTKISKIQSPKSYHKKRPETPEKNKKDFGVLLLTGDPKNVIYLYLDVPGAATYTENRGKSQDYLYNDIVIKIAAFQVCDM
jgi:hypothetical protein